MDLPDPETLKQAFKAAHDVVKHGIDIPLPEPLQDTFNLVVKPVISATKPMIRFVVKWGP